MKKISIFFCDIRGTIHGNNQKNTLNDYQLFSKQIDKLKEQEDNDEFLFSLISSDKMEFIQEQCQILAATLGKNVRLGYQIFENGYINDSQIFSFPTGKPFQIITYLNELKKRYIINKIYFADDCEFEHFLISNLLNPEDQKKLVSIIPKNKLGLQELNHLLDSEIKLRAI